MAFPGLSAWAFGTINALGQHSEHERITRWALKAAGFGPLTLDQLAGAHGAFGAVGAPDKPWRGLVAVKAAHCDGGDYLATPNYPQSQDAARQRLVDCRAWMFSRLDAAVHDAGQLDKATPAGLSLGCSFDGRRGGSAKCDVLEDLGLSFHASQDFYAHTNWVDEPGSAPIGPSNPPGLGHTGPAPWIDPRQDAAFPDGLISGCWDGVPEPLYCGAGGPNPRVAHRNLNKDDGLIDVAAETIAPGETARGRVSGNFERAVAAAVADTRDKWAYFETRIHAAYGDARGDQILCLLRSDDATNC
jgi:hypothetical protein